ncbi:hypothetical protein SAMN04490187_2387 [Pseudomonas jessenii]|jgi:hypothetical protein|uniref:Uncharacterized protein n=2 Tax=Pseudomonas TaxID=286 RepID=A0A1H4N3N0_PSEJE|nr:hypothetical protein SAMN04490187_2387 [Pseudomonas jessenii]VVP79435.1 hypothetical protein PS922_01681 [Pseudomonas fluorescens]
MGLSAKYPLTARIRLLDLCWIDGSRTSYLNCQQIFWIGAVDESQ